MQKPLVSILVPFMNTEAFLGECIQSIIEQTYQNWEILMVDDHSDDGSYNLVKQFTKTDSRIKLFKNTGSGIIDALQLAFSKSTGDLITRMDSDDIMMPNKIEVLSNNLLISGKKHIAVGLVKYFAEGGVKLGYKSYENWLNKLTKTGSNYNEIYKECVIPSPSWMVFREDLLACGAFNPNVYPEDYDLAFRFYKNGYKCIPCNSVLHRWRDYSTRTSRTHVHYAENHFIPLKLQYFLELDCNPDKTLLIWGAGKKGKAVAGLLIEKHIPFEWICDNPKKIGKNIYGKTMKPFEVLAKIKNPQSIITVANKEAQKEIIAFLKDLNLKPVEDYIFFC